MDSLQKIVRIVRDFLLLSKNEVGLPRALHRYNKSDYVLQEKAKFVFYLSIILVFTMVFLVFLTMYIQVQNPVYGRPYLPVLVPQIVAFFVFLVCMVVLAKGYYSFAANLMLISALLAVWLVIAFDKSDALGRLDTLFYVFAALSMAPLLAGKWRYSVFIYPLVNILLVVGFVVFFKDGLRIKDASVNSFLLDAVVSIVLVGLVGFNTYRINRRALERAEKDIGVRQEAEAALARSEKQYRELAELLPQTIFEADLTGRFIYVNKTGFDLFGYTDEDFLRGVNLLDMIAPEDRERAIEGLKSIMGGTRTKGEDYTAVRKNGTTFPAQIYSSAIVDDGKVIGVRGTVIDITQRKEYENALKTSEELFRTAIEFMPNAVTITDMDGKFLLVNQSFTKETGLEAREVIGKTIDEVDISIDSEFKSTLQSLRSESGLVENFELRIRNKLQQEVFLYYSSRVVQLLDRVAVLTSTVNITERKRIEMELERYRDHLEMLVKERTEELATANEELLSINEELHTQREELERALAELRKAQKQLVQTEKMASLGVMASGVAHEINNPLNYIAGGVYAIDDYIRNNLGNHTKELEPFIDAVNTGVQRTTEIIRGLNRFSSQTTSMNERCDVHAVVNNCLSVLNFQLTNRIDVERSYADKDIFVRGNEGNLHQAIFNVLSNSIQAIDGDGFIKIRTSMVDGHAVVVISDSGCGINSDCLGRIFDPFYTTKDPGQGTGLGLTLVYDIIKEMSGTIEFDSIEGHGTTVTIKLPAIA